MEKVNLKVTLIRHWILSDLLWLTYSRTKNKKVNIVPAMCCTLCIAHCTQFRLLNIRR